MLHSLLFLSGSCSKTEVFKQLYYGQTRISVWKRRHDMKKHLAAVLVFLLLGGVSSAQNSADTGRYVEGDGGRGIRIAVLPLQGGDLAADEEWLLTLIQSCLTADFNKFSFMTIVDRQNLETVLAEQNQSLSGSYSDADYVSIGSLVNAQYITAGSLKKITNGTFFLELSITGAGTGVRRASYGPKNCSLGELRGLSVLKEAAADLLSQMGVRLTEAGRHALRDSAAASAGTADSIRTEVRERNSFKLGLQQRAEALYKLGEIRDALWYYKCLTWYFPQYYNGWLGIVRCYSEDFENFDFYDCEVYMDRAVKMAVAASEKRETSAVFARFQAQWPEIQIRREQRKAEEAKRREDNFHNMRFVSENGVLKAYTGNEEEVFIPDNITVIGDAAFRQNGRVKRVVLHDKITAICRNAFARCTALTEIVIPPSVKTIGDSAFYDCWALASAAIPSSITVIPENAFAGCKNLTDITIGGGVTTIGKAFTGCEKLDKVLIPRNVTSIAGFAFSQCKSLKNITILNDAVTIGRRAFLACPIINKDELISRFGAAIFN
jgi:hypothetical protein